MYRILILFVFLGLSFTVFGQDAANELDYLKSEFQIKDNQPTVLIVYSDIDCFMCALPLSKLATVAQGKTEIKVPKNLAIKIITNNYAMAAKYKRENELDAEIIYNKKFTDSSGSQAIFIDHEVLNQFSINNISESSLNDLFNTSENNIDLGYAFVDSIFHFDFFYIASTPYGVLLFDDAIQTGIFTDFQTQTYLTPKFEDSSIIKNLPIRIEENLFERPPYFAHNQNLLMEEGIDYLHVKTIQYLDSTLLISFMINNRLKDLRQENHYGVFPSYYMAKKEINAPEDLLTAFDIDTYSEIYFVDTFLYNDTIYPLGPWISHQPIPINKDTFKINVMSVKDEDYKFGGLATIDISDPQEAKMINIDTDIAPTMEVKKNFNYQGQEYYVEKTKIDEEKSLGNIRFVPTEE